MNLKSAKIVSQVIPIVEQDPRWARIMARDKTTDGQFWYSVMTTGVYYRRSCP